MPMGMVVGEEEIAFLLIVLRMNQNMDLFRTVLSFGISVRGKCVNPDHLELGTVAENNADMVRDGVSNKGKQFPTIQGNKHYKSKLTEDQVKDIRRRHNETLSQLAREFGIHKATVHDILVKKTWKHVDSGEF